MLRVAAVVLLGCWGLVTAQTVKQFENVNVERNIDVSSQLVRVTAKITAENKGAAAASSYHVAIDADEAKQLSYISATSESIPLGVVLDKAASTKDVALYKVTLPTSISPGKTIKLDFVYVLTHWLEPFPSEVQQDEKQLVIYRGNHYLFSPYTTAKQTTKVKLASNRVESYTNTLKPNAQSDSSVTYGPYLKIAALTKEPFKVHYENQNSFLVVKNLKRWIEVSHWGTVQVEETVDVKHEGARLKGSFSRYDFQREMSPSAAVKTFKTFLPSGARDVYYRDEIGNISTSHLRKRFDAVEVELRPRFPLFGGWKTHYLLGYSVPTTDFLLHDGVDGFVLKINFIDHIFDDAVIDNAVVKIVLPEGSREIRLKLPFSAQRHPDERHYTYLDTTGRVVVVLSKQNLVEDHIQPLEVHYKFNKMRMFQEPLLVAVALFILFTTVIIYVRLDFSIRSDPNQEQKWKLLSLQERIARSQDRRDAIYAAIDQSLAKFKLSKDQAGFEASLKKNLPTQKLISEEFAQHEEEAKAGAMNAALETIAELNKLDKILRDTLNYQVSILEKFIAGKLNKQQYTDQEMVQSKKKHETYEKIRDIICKL
ncbi:dolichyl-diphosphooligosaccharide--protein glycosyltransferase subunit 1 [Galendromus occidentalis]|uniref:Dolichyl-diphosphooligosaccharide--protein glycosyltransferase subunit 1 n=1 Tax=Galendromus occidentalis TaxID=34638 RepID=A0AAJ6VZ96_9ACAR|nr:dolichyl-diphosphooligosaccharide--protein glycosyltransferase subunit 1 [Galendromus occidentalis]